MSSQNEQKSDDVDVETITDIDTDTEKESSESDRGSDYDGNRKKNAEEKRKKKKTNRIGFDSWLKRYRETKWDRWRVVYCQLLEPAYACRATSNSWRDSLYRNQLQDKLGDSRGFIDTSLIPLSLITAMQSSRVHKN